MFNVVQYIQTREYFTTTIAKKMEEITDQKTQCASLNAKQCGEIKVKS